MPWPSPHKRRRIVIVTSDDEGGGLVPAPLSAAAEAVPPPQLDRPVDLYGEHHDRLIPEEVGGEACIGGGSGPAPLTAAAEAVPPPQLGRPFDRFGEHLNRLLPSEVGGKAFIDHLEGFVSSDSGSSDSDDPVSRKGRKLALRMHLEQVKVRESALAPFLYAAKHGCFPQRSTAPPPVLLIPECLGSVSVS